jgi:UDP-glucose 4-epimerase
MRVRAVVTGGAGFIGSHVADALLARGDEVTVVDDLSAGKREQVPADARFVEADVRGPLDDLFDDVRPEVCFHLAGQIDLRVATREPAMDADINVLGTIQVLEAARRSDAEVVFASTGGAIYGECDRPAAETAALLPISPYGVSKLAAEEYLAAFNRLYGTRHVSLRYGNVYGPRQDPHGEAGVVAIFFRALAAGERPPIYGDGRQTRDLVAVEDAVRATLAAPGQAGVFNIGTGRETSVLEIFDLCRKIAGANVEPELAPAREGELQRSVLDPGLAARELGWKPEVPLEQGLEDTWRWIRSA